MSKSGSNRSRVGPRVLSIEVLESRTLLAGFTHVIAGTVLHFKGTEDADHLKSIYAGPGGTIWYETQLGFLVVLRTLTAQCLFQSPQLRFRS